MDKKERERERRGERLKMKKTKMKESERISKRTNGRAKGKRRRIPSNTVRNEEERERENVENTSHSRERERENGRMREIDVCRFVWPFTGGSTSHYMTTRCLKMAATSHLSELHGCLSFSASVSVVFLWLLFRNGLVGRLKDNFHRFSHFVDPIQRFISLEPHFHVRAVRQRLRYELMHRYGDTVSLAQIPFR